MRIEPLLPTDLSEEGGKYLFHWSVDTAADPYLSDHLVGGLPVFPAAYLLALMITGTSRLLPDRKVREVADVRFEQPAYLRPGRPLRFSLSVDTCTGSTGSIHTCIGSEMDPPKPHFPPIRRVHSQSDILVSSTVRQPSRYHPIDFSGARDYSALYDLTGVIWHGPSFRLGRCYRQPTPDQLLAAVGPTDEGWGGAGTGPWPAPLLNGILHVGFSLGLLTAGTPVVPTGVKRCTFYQPPEGVVQVLARLQAVNGDTYSVYVTSWDTAGQAVATFSGFTLRILPVGERSHRDGGRER